MHKHAFYRVGGAVEMTKITLGYDSQHSFNTVLNVTVRLSN